MKHTITVSAPGKLMLFGEHAVVYNRPCLVTAVNQRMKMTVEVLDSQELQLEALDVNVIGYRKKLSELGKGDIPKGAMFVEIAVKNISEKYPLKSGLRITTASRFSSQFGIGSSSAATVCAIKAVSELFGLNLSLKDMFAIAFKTTLAIQGKSSGFDVAVGLYGGTLYFTTGGKIIEPLAVKSLPLIVAYSGIKADTVTLIGQVTEKANKYPLVIETIFNSVEQIVKLAKPAIVSQDWQTVGELMNFNQGYLASLGVSNKRLASMIYAAREWGAYGAKLSGAGGGDCIIALAPDEKRKAVEDSITQAKGQLLSITANAKGVKIES